MVYVFQIIICSRFSLFKRFKLNQNERKCFYNGKKRINGFPKLNYIRNKHKRIIICVNINFHRRKTPLLNIEM